MKQENNNKLRTVALRILPALILVSLLVCSVTVSAAASGFNYEDYIVDESYNDVVCQLPLTSASWLLCGYPSMAQIATDNNPATFLLDHTNLSGDSSYALVCSPFGTYGIDVTNIPDNASMSFSFSVLEDTVGMNFETFTVQYDVYYWSADNQILSHSTYVGGTADAPSRTFTMDDFVVDKPEGADHLSLMFYFLDLDLDYWGDLSVTFSLENIFLYLDDVRNVTSTGTLELWNYSGAANLASFSDVIFPCTVSVGTDGIMIYNFESDDYDYFFSFSDLGEIVGLSNVRNANSILYSTGITFTLYQPGSLYLIGENDLPGYIDILDYSGQDEIFTIDSVKFPCQVYVDSGGLLFTYADSDVVSYYYPFSGTGTFVGVSLIPYDSDIRYPIGYSFTLYGDDQLYLILEGDVKDFSIVDPDSTLPEFDIDDFDSSQVSGWFSDFSGRLNLPFTNVFLLFWESELLHNILLISAIFSVFSYLMFGKKG